MYSATSSLHIETFTGHLLEHPNIQRLSYYWYLHCKLWTSELLPWFTMITKCWYLKETFLKKCACVSLCELDLLHLLTRHLAKMTWHSLSHSRSICTFRKCWSEFVMFSWLHILKCIKYIRPRLFEKWLILSTRLITIQ